MQKFAEVQGMSAVKNPEETKEKMTDLLKDFHLYWNKLRQKGELGRVKGETKNLMKKLLQNYDQREKFLFEMAKTFV